MVIKLCSTLFSKIMKSIILSILIITTALEVSAQHQEPSFSRIDQHARNAPWQYGTDPEKLVAYLIQPAKNNWQKVRAIFVWMTDNIAYDTYSLYSGTVSHEKCKPMNVLRNRKGVCSGYANLFEFLCGYAEINCWVIEGYAKGASHYTGKVFHDTNHAWNMCEIDGKGHLFDVTWAAGHVSYGSFTRKFNEFWWDTPPNLFVTTHYAASPVNNLLSYAFSKSQFEMATPIRSYPTKKRLTKKRSANGTTRVKTHFCWGGAYGLALSDLPDIYYQPESEVLYLLAGLQTSSNTFWGFFPALHRYADYSTSIEAGVIWHNWLRLSAGWRDPSYHMFSSTTVGIHLPMRNMFIALDVNRTGYHDGAEYQALVSAGFRF